MSEDTTANRATPEPAVSGGAGALLEAARPHHWLKNGLLFVPMWLGHDVTIGNALLVLIGAACFSAMASAGYLVNDLLDVAADRGHRTKRLRPIAAGRLSVGTARVAAGIAVVGATVVSAAALGGAFTALLLLYLGLTLVYSTWLKRLALVDVVMLAGLYTLRLFAGGVAVDVELSSWLLAFSTFVFLSLAFAKRYTEVVLHTDDRTFAEQLLRRKLFTLLGENDLGENASRTDPQQREEPEGYESLESDTSDDDDPLGGYDFPPLDDGEDDDPDPGSPRNN
ncbi:MAG: UbiA prenyltransferase family protein [Planctomycetota bacterium]